MSEERIVRSPIGALRLVASGEGLEQVEFASKERPNRAEERGNDFIEQAARELEEYFAGARQRFEVALCRAVGTPFQREVWAALERIPFGDTRSYAQLASSI